MADLSVRLNAGDPAPADGVLVPLYGPTGDERTGYPWRTLARHLHSAWSAMADAIEAIADVAEADPPLKRGDRVRVGKAEGVITNIDPDSLGQQYQVQWPNAMCAWLPDAAVCKAIPLTPRYTTAPDDLVPAIVSEKRTPGYGTATVVDRAIDDALASDEPPERLSSEDVRQALKVEWTPAEGMLVERISNGECFRLELPWGGGWNSKQVDGLEAQIGNHALAQYYRPRFLRVGDVIEKVNGRDDRLGLTGAAIEVITVAHLQTEWGRATREVAVHVKGLGLVPWPPEEEA